jgi:c-di-GMP-binding flagellar brake protein YcgR
MAERKIVNRRRYVRFETQNVLHYEKYSLVDSKDKAMAEATAKNISAGGVLFETKTKYQPGDVLLLEIDLSGWDIFSTEFNSAHLATKTKSKSVRILGKVVRVEMIDQDKFDVGISFSAIDEGHKWSVIKYT